MRKLFYIVSIVILGTAMFLPCYSQGQRKSDSLQILLQTEIHDTTRIHTLNSLAWELNNNNLDTAILLSTQALALSEKIMWKKGIGKAHHNLGSFNRRKSNYPLSLSHYHLALGIWEELMKQEPPPAFARQALAGTVGNIGIVFKNQGKYIEALEYYFKSLRIEEEIGNKIGIAVTFNNIGLIYADQGDYPKALEYYFKGLKMDEELGNKNGIAARLGNIGSVYHAQAERKRYSNQFQDSMGRNSIDSLYAKGLEYYLKALKMNEEIGRKRGIGINLSNIGLIYREQGNYLKAMECYFKALKLDQELGEKASIAIDLGSIGSLYTTQKKYPEAESYLLQALELDTAIGYLEHTKYIHEQLSTLYEQTGQYKMAYEHYKEYSIAKDSLFNEGKSKDLGKLEAKYEFDKAEAERKRIEEDMKAASAIAEQRRNNLQYSGILIFLVLLGAGLIALGRFSISIRLAEGLIFFTFLLFFEFTLVLLDPYIEQYSAGAPAIKLGFNALLAGMIFPLHSFFEEKLKSRMVKSNI